MNNWHGLLKIIEISCTSPKGEVICKYKNLNNILHNDGENFILSSLFVDNTSLPNSYYFGLDNRPSVSSTQTLADLVDEPSTHGYARVEVGVGVFTISLAESDVYMVSSPTIDFTSSGGSWGPVKNLFLATSLDSTGYLISSIALPSQITVMNGATVSLRMGLSLQDIPV